MSDAAPYGLFAAFDGPQALVSAARRLRGQGYAALDAHTPYPVDGLDAALGLGRSRIGWVILAGAIIGAVAAYGLALYSVTVAYPINVGGRPLHAWPPFALLAFEGGVLGGALSALAGLLVLSRLPAYHHPSFDFPDVDFAEERCFVLLVRATDARYEPGTLRRLLQEAGALRIGEVAA